MRKNKKTKFSVSVSLEKRQFPFQFSLPDIKKRMQFVLGLMCENPTEVCFRFCDREEMLTMNSQFRGKNHATDVLSFPHTPNFPLILDQEACQNSCYLGDILICVPVCIDQAKKAKISLGQELEKMMIHGLVHLKGFDHERGEAAWVVMSGLEKLLQKELTQEMGKPTWITLRSGF